MNHKRTLLAVLLTLTLLFSAFTVCVSAEETTAESVSSEESTAAVSGEETSGEEVTSSEESGEESSGSESGEETTKASESTTAKPETTGSTSSTTKKDDHIGKILRGVIGAIIGVTVVVLALVFILAKDDGSIGKNGEKVPFGVRGKRFFRSCKSEAKNVVWTPWKTVRKNTLVVLAVVAALAIAIGLLDWVFSKGIIALTALF